MKIYANYSILCNNNSYLVCEECYEIILYFSGRNVLIISRENSNVDCRHNLYDPLTTYLYPRAVNNIHLKWVFNTTMKHIVLYYFDRKEKYTRHIMDQL